MRAGRVTAPKSRMFMKFIENTVFALRIPILIAFAAFTVYSAIFAVNMRLDAGFDKQLPYDHPYIKTFNEFRDRLFGANRVIIVLRDTEGDIFNKEYLAKLKGVSDDVFFLPGVDRRTVTSLWTPNTRILEITEEGITARDLIPGRFTPETLTDDAIRQLQNDVVKGGFVGRLVSNDFTGTMIVAELLEVYNVEDPVTKQRRTVKLDYLDLAEKLETQIRAKYEDPRFEVHVIGFTKIMGDIADGARSVIIFFALAFLLTTLCVYYYARSWALVFLALSCSLTSLIWQFGILNFLGFGLDPLAILVPFLVFAIGVSHGVQQLNLVTREIANGKNAEEAARSSFTGLLIPGTMALTTDLAGFATLYLVPIPMIQELAITASIGIALKILTNIIMLPLLASYCGAFFTDAFIARVRKARASRIRMMRVLGMIAHPVPSYIMVVLGIGLFAFAYVASMNRHVGDLHPGSPELRPEARYNYDARIISHKFTIGLDLLTVVVETPAQACISPAYMQYLNEFSWYMQNQAGVRSVASIAFAAKQTSSGWNEGNLKWRALPANASALTQAVGSVPAQGTGLLDFDCTLLPVLVFTTDSKAETIKGVTAAAQKWIDGKSFAPVLSAGTDHRARQLPVAAGQTIADAAIKSGEPDSAWTLTRAQLQGLTYTPLPDHTEPFAITVQGFAGPQPAGEPAATAEIQVTPGEPGKGQPLDVAGVTGGPEWANVQTFLLTGVPDAFYVRLASGNVGVTAAINDAIAVAEFPMMLIVYGVIIALVFLTYWDWRATLVCCVPLTVATFLGYAFMEFLDIGLKVSTLPVMVLAVGIGVDYAFYIYNRVQFHLSRGDDITLSYQKAMKETGMAVVFVSLTFAIGVSTWSFSDLKFQADMGMLLTFMFLINMIMAITLLPAIAVVLDRNIPRRSLPKAPPGEEEEGEW